jgi:hypothetical protein
MLKLKFFVFLVLTMLLAWFGFSHVFSQWADRAQADAEVLALQTARAVSAQLTASPHASLARSSALKQTLAALPNSSIARAGQELSRRLAEIFPDWGAEDIALLVLSEKDKASEKVLWLMGQQWLEKAPEAYTKQVVLSAAARQDLIEVGNGMKAFFFVEPPAETDNGLNLWIGGPAMHSWESSLAQELKRTPALGLGVVVSGKLVIEAGQPQQAHYLSLLKTAVSNIQPGSVGILKNAGKQGGNFISTFWGTSKPFAADGVAVRQSLGIGNVELLVVLNNTVAQEALLSAQRVAFYGWMAVFLLGLLVGFVVLPAGLKLAPGKKEAEAAEQTFALPSSPSSPSLPSLSSPPFFVVEGSKALAGASVSKAEPLVSPKLLELLQPEKPEVSPASLDFAQEEPSALGLHGKAVQPDELLGIDHAPHENPAAVFEATLREEAERFFGADFLPEHSSLSGEVLSTSAVEGPEAAEWRNVFSEFLRVRKQCNQDIESLNFERFKAKLEVSKNNLLAKHHCKTVRFLVQIKDGKAAIKAIPVRDTP